MSTLFAKAKQEAPKVSTTAKAAKQIIAVNVGDKIKDLLDKREQIKTLEADVAMLEGDLKPLAREKFLELYKKDKRKPESFVLQGGAAKILVIVQDKYLKITEVKEQMLRENKLDAVIDEKTVYSFNTELLQKYEKPISDAISKIKAIPDEDKEKLIEATVEKSVKKGTIETLATFKNIDQVFNLIEPVVQLKNQ